MAILRGCGRCGGDILTADANNIRCLQCGHRPALPITALRRHGKQVIDGGGSTPKAADVNAIFDGAGAPQNADNDSVDRNDADADARCPRCEDTAFIALEKLRPHFNTCYRCQLCGHIFSPAALKSAS